MKLNPSSKSLAKNALAFSLIACLCLGLSGCDSDIKPTYKEEEIPYFVKDICKKEYGIDVAIKRTPTTLWIYLPLNKILHKEYGLKEDKIFDEEMSDKLRNTLNTIGRVLISSDNTPEFFALTASDINLGLDYTLIGSVLDMKKSYAGFLPWTEANRRYVMRFKIAPQAIGDKTGVHLETDNINLPDFLAEQIAQRVNVQLQEEGKKKYFKVEKAEGKFSGGVFSFDYSVKEISKPEKPTDIKKEILKTVTYCIQTYDFKDFSSVEMTDLTTQDRLTLSKVAIWKRPID
jgi:hypothetical protein